MTAADAVLLLAAGFGAGSVNAVAGGGSLLSFPALLATGYSLTAVFTADPELRDELRADPQLR